MKELCEHIQSKVKSVKLLSVSEQDVVERKFSLLVKGFRGTMFVHQVLWSSYQLRKTFLES